MMMMPASNADSQTASCHRVPSPSSLLR
jgi:hypothetical protein